MSRRTYPIPNKNLSGSDYIANKRAKQLFSGTSNLAKTIEQQGGNFPLLTPLGALKPYEGTFGLSGRSDLTLPSDKTYCLNTSHSYKDLLDITKGKYLLTPPNISSQSSINVYNVNNSTRLYNGVYYVYIYSNTTNALYFMNPAYPTTPATYVPNQILYDVTGNANQRIIVDPSYVLTYVSQSCIHGNVVSSNITINNDQESRHSLNRTINLALLTGFQYPSKFSLDYDNGDCINANNDLQSNYAAPLVLSNITPPAITGTTLVGSTLTCSTGTWTGFFVPTFTYQWFRNATPISGATNNTYLTQSPADIGQTITCSVTATNSNGSSSPVTSSNSVIPTSAPVNLVAPSITPTSGVAGATFLTCSNGTWAAFPAISTFTYQWVRNATFISGANNFFYMTQTPIDAGQAITCRVTAVNSVGSSSPATSSNSVIPTLFL